MRLHSAVAFFNGHYAHRSNKGDGEFFCSTELVRLYWLLSILPSQKTCAHGYDSHPIRAIRVFLFPLTSPGEHGKGFAYLPTVWLASWRIRLNCFFILYFPYLTPTVWNIPHYFSQFNGPCSKEAQRKIQSPIFPSLVAGGSHRKHLTISYFPMKFLHEHFPPLPA